MSDNEEETCKYITGNGRKCKTKSIHSEGLCKNHRNLKKALTIFGLEPSSDYVPEKIYEAPVVPGEAKKKPVIKALPNKKSTSEPRTIKIKKHRDHAEEQTQIIDPYEQQDQKPIIRPKVQNKVPTFKLKEILRPSVVETSGEPSEIDEKEEKAFMSRFAKDQNLSLPPVPQDSNLLSATFDQVDGSLNKTANTNKRPQPPVSKKPTVSSTTQKIADEENGNDGVEGLHAVDPDDLDSPEEQGQFSGGSGVLLTNAILKIGFFTAVQLGENMASPHLNGILEEIKDNQDIHDCLDEMAYDYEQYVNLGDSSPETRLLVLLAAIGFSKYTNNRLANKATENTMKMNEKPADTWKAPDAPRQVVRISDDFNVI